MIFAENAQDAADRLSGFRLVSAEFMYRPRPTDPRARYVFDYALRSRLAELAATDGAAVLLICRDEETAASLSPVLANYPALQVIVALANPEPVENAGDAQTPWLVGWDVPERWQRYTLTDRWARILVALDVARRLGEGGFLVMPANDAVWGSGLLVWLLHLSRQHGRNGQPAAISPYTPWQHAPVPGLAIDPQIINALNAAFNRDASLRARMQAGQGQAFWGKMGVLPFGVCDLLYRQVERGAWEDDLEIDRVLKEVGYGVRAVWVAQRALYHQALPVFNRDDLRRVFERTLHYSLNIPTTPPGGHSLLNAPLDPMMALQRQVSPRFDAALTLSESIVAECNVHIRERLALYSLSWVDWGAYRYVVRVGDPWVQVWKSDRSLL
jgi:hypothetical protein